MEPCSTPRHIRDCRNAQRAGPKRLTRNLNFLKGSVPTPGLDQLHARFPALRAEVGDLGKIIGILKVLLRIHQIPWLINPVADQHIRWKKTAVLIQKINTRSALRAFSRLRHRLGIGDCLTGWTGPQPPRILPPPTASHKETLRNKTTRTLCLQDLSHVTIMRFFADHSSLGCRNSGDRCSI